MSYDNTDSGVLYKNDNPKSEKHPQYSGSLNVGGVEYFLDAWVNEGKPGSKMEGRKYFKVKVKAKSGTTASAPATAPKSATAPLVQDDDSIPF